MGQPVDRRSSKRAGSQSRVVARGGRTAVRLVEQAQQTEGPRSRPGSAKQRRPRGAEIRDRILRVALEYFGTFGFEATSTRAVAERAEVTHTLVLYHFKSKEKLWIATIEEALKPYAAAFQANKAIAIERPARDALATFIEQFIRMSARQPQIHRLMTMDSNQDTSRLDWVIDHFISEHFQFVRDLIRRGQLEGSVRRCDPARLYYLIIGAGGTPYTLKTEYKALTGRDVFSEAEILRNTSFISDIVFVPGAATSAS